MPFRCAQVHISFLAHRTVIADSTNVINFKQACKFNSTQSVKIYLSIAAASTMGILFVIDKVTPMRKLVATNITGELLVAVHMQLFKVSEHRRFVGE